MQQDIDLQYINTLTLGQKDFELKSMNRYVSFIYDL